MKPRSEPFPSSENRASRPDLIVLIKRSSSLLISSHLISFFLSFHHNFFTSRPRDKRKGKEKRCHKQGKKERNFCRRSRVRAPRSFNQDPSKALLQTTRTRPSVSRTSTSASAAWSFILSLLLSLSLFLELSVLLEDVGTGI